MLYTLNQDNETKTTRIKLNIIKMLGNQVMEKDTSQRENLF